MSSEPTDRPRIDVVFVLDCTGSMGALIRGAQEKIWSIANTMAVCSPAPELRMGLVAYRDRCDPWVVKHTDLTIDLDAVYDVLMDYTAQGGGDLPEAVNEGLHAAVARSQWTSSPGAYRVVFLLGDAPPHMDYDDVKYPVSCAQARAQDIVVNTIQCGTVAGTEPYWREIATLGGGQYFRVEQSGGAVVLESPFDADLAGLARELEATRLYYGSAEAQRIGSMKAELSSRIQTKASIQAQAERAAYNSTRTGTSNLLGSDELIDAVANGRIKLDAIDPALLPGELQGRTPAERAEEVEYRRARRESLLEQIRELNERRKVWLREHLARASANANASFDAAVYECIRAQAALKGIRFDAR